jgi:hypothetical protein
MVEGQSILCRRATEIVPVAESGAPATASATQWYLCSGHRMARGIVAAPSAAVALGVGFRQTSPLLRI